MNSTTTLDPTRLTQEFANLWSSDWKSPVSKSVVRPYKEGDLQRGWKAWTAYLEKRDKPQDIARLWSGKQSPLLWVVPAGLEDRDTVSLVKQLGKLARRKTKKGQEIAEQIVPWLREAKGASPDAAAGIEHLAWAYALPRLAAHAEATNWWELLEHLLATAVDSGGLDSEAAPLHYNLLAGELPLVLGYQFPELKSCHKLLATARRNLSRSLIDLLDGEGLPHARHIPQMRMLLACWTRCARVGDELKGNAWDQDAQSQYEWMVTQSLRLARADGSQLFAQPPEGAWSKALFQMAVDLGGDEADTEIARHIFPGDAKSTMHYEWPASAVNSEWAEVSLLQDQWYRQSRKLLVSYDNRQTRLELNSGADQLLDGLWTFEIKQSGQPVGLAADAEWEQLAWESDEEVDFMELEIDLAGGLRLQRSFLLSRKDQFLLLADVILGSEPHDLEYTGQLPLSKTVDVRSSKVHAEISLCTSATVARVLPLALSEWRVDSSRGTLGVENNKLVLGQTGKRSLLAPIFIDLSRHRSRKSLTWRRLSVGEERRNVAADVALGYRVQIGDEQWLIYRSLDRPSNRTVLGQNLVCEMHVSRFLDDGEVEDILEIE